MDVRDLPDRAAAPAVQLSLARAWVLIGAGVLGVSLSGPIVAAAVAVPALAVAFWRNLFGTLATLAAVVLRRSTRRELLAVRRPALADTGRAGVLLAVHFGTWIPSLRLTSVATATALVSVSPLWILGARRLRGVRVPRATLAGAALGVAGVLVITGVDVGRSPSVLAGDALALAGGAAAAAYTSVGERARRTVSTPVYTLLVYGTCAATLLPVCLALGVPLAGWDAGSWGLVVLLTLVAQLLGHTAFNAAVPVVGATALSLAILLEVPGSTAVAWLWPGQAPPPGAVPGLVAVLAGLALVVRAGRGRVPLPEPVRTSEAGP